jgi:hypothetical protein
LADQLKGIIFIVAREYAKHTLGEERTRELLEKSGLADKPILATKDYPNKLLFGFISLLGKDREMNLLEAVHEGGRYFASTYAPQSYRAFYILNRDFRRAMQNFPRICSIALEGQEIGNYAAVEVRQPDEGTYRVRYESPFGSTAYSKGLVEGLSDYYQTPVQLRDLSTSEFEVQLKG